MLDLREGILELFDEFKREQDHNVHIVLLERQAYSKRYAEFKQTKSFRRLERARVAQKKANREVARLNRPKKVVVIKQKRVARTMEFIPTLCFGCFQWFPSELNCRLHQNHPSNREKCLLKSDHSGPAKSAGSCNGTKCTEPRPEP